MKSTGMLLITVGLIALPTVAHAEEGHGQADKTPDAIPEMCQKMMAERKGMMSGMQNMDTAMDEKLAKVKSTKGDAKIEALTDLVEALMNQRKGMHAHMMSGMPKMMGHMMSHMGDEKGMMGDGMAMMANCPMMQGSEIDDSGDAKKSDDHSAHH